MTERELYVKISNVFTHLLFSVDRVKNYDSYQSEVYYQDVLRELISLEQLERQYPKYWRTALRKAIEMQVNIALNSMESRDQKFRDLRFESVINIFLIFKKCIFLRKGV